MWLSVSAQYPEEFRTFLIYILCQLSVPMQDVECSLCSKLESKGKIYFKQSCLLDRLTVSESPSPHTNPDSELGGGPRPTIFSFQNQQSNNYAHIMQRFARWRCERLSVTFIQSRWATAM